MANSRTGRDRFTRPVITLPSDVRWPGPPPLRAILGGGPGHRTAPLSSPVPGLSSGAAEAGRFLVCVFLDGCIQSRMRRILVKPRLRTHSGPRLLLSPSPAERLRKDVAGDLSRVPSL